MEFGKKKLIFVITQPVLGGAQKYVFDLARYFSKKAFYDVVVAAGGPPEGYLFGELAKEKIKTHFLRNLGRPVKIWADISAFLEILSFFRRAKPDIVHLNSSKAGAIGALAGWLAGAKVIYTVHGWVFNEDWPRWQRAFYFLLEFLSARLKDRIICVSERDFWQALRCKIAPPRKVYTIYNAIAGKIMFRDRAAARDEIGRKINRTISDDTILLVNLGRLYATKGLAYLVEAVAQLKSKIRTREIILVIFGDGPEKESLKFKVESLKLEENVFLAGDTPNAAQLLRACDVMVLSSTKEGLPYALVEAGLAGLAAVATDVGGVSEIIENTKTGVLVPARDSASLAAGIEMLINDNTKAQKLATELKKMVQKKFDFKEMVEKTEWVYKV